MASIKTKDGKNIFLKETSYINNIQQSDRKMDDSDTESTTFNKGSILTLDRLIYINGEFDEDMAKDITLNLLDLSIKDNKTPIVLMIDSFGGYIYSLLQIIDIVESLPNKIYTIVTGKAMSAAGVLALCGTKGNRYVLKNGTIMLHSLKYGAYGSIEEHKIQLEESRKLEKLLNEIISKKSNIDKKSIEEFMRYDNYIDPKTAVELGIVDAVINKTIMKDITSIIRPKKDKNKDDDDD